MDAPRTADDKREKSFFLTADDPSPEDAAANRQDWLEKKQQLLDALSRLDARERAIVEQRHLAEEPRTLSEMGKHFGVSRERVRQIELRAFAKIRRHFGMSSDSV